MPMELEGQYSASYEDAELHVALHRRGGQVRTGDEGQCAVTILAPGKSEDPCSTVIERRWQCDSSPIRMSPALRFFIIYTSSLLPDGNESSQVSLVLLSGLLLIAQHITNYLDLLAEDVRIQRIH